MEYKEVEWLFQRDVEETYNITVGDELITTTEEHPFWIVGKGWVEAQHLVAGNVLTTSDGKELAIEKIEVKQEHATVYNFKVRDFHTYFVSNLGIWTLNKCGVISTGSFVLKDGMKMKTDNVLTAAEEFLEKGYKDMGSGRYVSADGTRVVRMGDSDILGKHGGGSHMNFETLVPNPNKPGKKMVKENLHIYLED